MQTAALAYNLQKSPHTVAVVAVAFVAESELSEAVEDSFVAAVAVGCVGDFAVVADRWVVLELEPFAAPELGPFVGLELVLPPALELVFVSRFDIVVVHTFAAAECRSAVAGYNLDCRKLFAEDVRQRL